MSLNIYYDIEHFEVAMSLNISKNGLSHVKLSLVSGNFEPFNHVVAMTTLEHTHDQGHHQLYCPPHSQLSTAA